MNYHVDRSVGYQRWGILNPWVFANYGQPQRGRGYVSPMAYKGGPLTYVQPNLGGLGTDEEDRARARRMEALAVAGVVMSGMSLYLFWSYAKRPKIEANRRRRRRR